MRKVYTYDYFQTQSTKTSRLKNKLPNDTLKMMGMIKDKLNIKDKALFIRPTYMDKTVIAKKEKELGELYKLLNKISDKTYDKLIVQVLDTLKNINEVNYFEMITSKIFDIISSNDFYSELFARLYKDIAAHHKIFLSLFVQKYNVHINQFENIEYVSPNENYDDYCSYVKKLDAIRSMTNFVLCCHTHGVCGLNEVMDLIVCLQKKIINNLEVEEKISENESCINNIFIIYQNKLDHMIDSKQWDEIRMNHQILKDTSGKGKNNKIRFKLMDIDDLIRKK